MPRIDKNLQSMIQQVRSGQQELDVQTARNLIDNVTADGKVSKSEELELLQGLDQMAPSGSVHGRELLKNFIDGAEHRLHAADQRSRSDYFSPRSETNPMTRMWNTWAQFNPYLSSYRVPSPTYATTEAKDSFTRTLSEQSEINTERALVGEDALRKLVEQYEGAYTTQFGYDLSVRDIPKDDVYDVYLQQVKDQPINEYD
ncbi:MAG: hypothetical protein H6728_12785, partial [Myxococcales bacterium]|nr:hypothetical protein [Myxococcales bacterium]